MRRLAVVQRVLADYNLPLYQRLAESDTLDICVFSMSYGLPPAQLGVREVLHPEGVNAHQERHARWVWSVERKLKVSLPSARVVRAIIRWRPDCILLEGLSNLGNVLLLFSTRRIHGASIVWWSLGAIPDRPNTWRSRIGDLLQQSFTRQCEAVISYSTHGARYFQDLGVPAEKVFVAHNTLDEQAVFKAIEDCRPHAEALRQKLQLASRSVAVFSGTINKGKRLDLLLRAFVHVKKLSQGSDPLLLVIGDGPALAEMKELASELGISDSVMFVGRQHEMASAYFQLAQFAVMPGLGGLAINHAFAHGLPVICGPADGCELDLVQTGATGIYLPVMNEANLIQAMSRLYADPALCATLGANARSLISQKITLTSYAQQIERVVHVACDAKHFHPEPPGGKA